ncbi:hypothetical protein BDW75DRAFT_240070 [Aspergillus navahoensis]
MPGLQALSSELIATIIDHLKPDDALLTRSYRTKRRFHTTAMPRLNRTIALSAIQAYRRIDYLINAAGYILDGAVEATPEEVQRQFAVNVFGTTNVIRAFLPHLRAQPVLLEKADIARPSPSLVV